MPIYHSIWFWHDIFFHASLMKPVDINPNDEWVNVRSFSDGFLLSSTDLSWASSQAFIISCKSCSTIFRCFLSFADGNGWSVTSDMYPWQCRQYKLFSGLLIWLFALACKIITDYHKFITVQLHVAPFVSP